MVGMMDIQKEKIKQEFWNWAKVENPRMVENAELGDVYAIQNLDHMFMGFAAAKSQAVPECVWAESYDGSVFESSCGHTFELSNDGNLNDNNMKHCCFCGGKIETQEQSHEFN